MTEEKYKSMQDSGNVRLMAQSTYIKEKTEDFLDICKRVGITKVSICMKHPSIPKSQSFCFGHFGSVFSESIKYQGWPAIWYACEQSGIGYGCGNGDQHQIKEEMVLDGVYHLIDNEWQKIA